MLTAVDGMLAFRLTCIIVGVPVFITAATKNGKCRTGDEDHAKNLLVHCKPHHMELGRRQNVCTKCFVIIDAASLRPRTLFHML